MICLDLGGRQFRNKEQVVAAFREWMQMPEPEFLPRRNIYSYVKMRQLRQNISGTMLKIKSISL